MEKSKRISARCNEQEYQVLLDKAERAKLSKADFIRQMVLSSTIKENDKNHQKRVLFLMNNLSNNINQIAHHANIHKQLDQKVLEELQEITSFIREISC